MSDKTKKRSPRFDDIVALSKRPPQRTTAVSPFALAYDADETRRRDLDKEGQVFDGKRDIANIGSLSLTEESATQTVNVRPVEGLGTLSTADRPDSSAAAKSDLLTVKGDGSIDAIDVTTALESTLQKTGTPQTGTPMVGTPQPGAPIPRATDTSTPKPGLTIADRHCAVPDAITPISGIPISGAPLSSPPISGPPFSGISLLQRRRIRRALQVQDGHSLGEQLILTTLWNNSSELPGKPYRRICIGYRTLSALCGLTVNNCKANLKSLEAKLAIETETGYSTTTGTTYKVFSFADILRRRDAARLTYVLKSKGALFVDPETGIPILGTRGTPVTGAPDAPKGIPITGEKGIPGPGSQLRTRKEPRVNQEKTAAAFRYASTAAATAAPLVLPEEVAMIHKAASLTIDDDTVRQLIFNCKANDPTATADEIAYFFQLVASQIAPQKNIANPVGLLILKVPNFFPSTKLTDYRRQKIEAAAAEIKEQERARETARQIQTDPDANADAREWADRILTESAKGK